MIFKEQTIFHGFIENLNRERERRFSGDLAQKGNERQINWVLFLPSLANLKKITIGIKHILFNTYLGTHKNAF